jgi:lipoprotein-anchoring transpeptidase ErfK/SrfK
VNATNAADKVTTKTASFTTLTPTEKLTIQQYMPDDGDVVGVGQPVTVNFTSYVPTDYRAAVERAMTVTTTPAVSGAWSWISETRVDWRPASYWPSGTKVHVHLGLNGVRAGEHQFGWEDRDFTFTIGSKVEALVYANSHEMKVYDDDKLLRTLPVDTGMPGFSTWGGIMPVLDKQPVVQMKSCSVGIACSPSSPLYYNLTVYDDVHLTASGTYVHNASWDSNIGKADASHGCIHLTASDAKWFYDLVKPGDIVRVYDEPKTVAEGNGNGDWNVSWKTWLDNSAIGVTSGATTG